MYTVYILQSQRNQRLYIGSTKNINQRIRRHNTGRNPSTRSGRPWNVIYTEQYPDQSSAVHREHQLKRQKHGSGIRKLLERWPSG